MRAAFKGFTRGKTQSIVIPAQFFSELLPQIDDAAELKATLFCMYALQQKEGGYRYLRYDEFLADEDLMRGLGVLSESTDPAKTLDAALDKATKRGTLLMAAVTLDHRKLCYYVINSERGRAFVDQIEGGEWRPVSADEIEVLPARPNVYALYEENIGMLTPMIKDSIQDAEASYPAGWIEDAIRVAVERNVRHWRYISKVLEGWQQKGRSRERSRRHLEQLKPERHKQITAGEWQDFFE